MDVPSNMYEMSFKDEIAFNEHKWSEKIGLKEAEAQVVWELRQR